MVKRELAALPSPRSGTLPDPYTGRGFLHLMNSPRLFLSKTRLVHVHKHTKIPSLGNIQATLYTKAQRNSDVDISTSDASHRSPSPVRRNTGCYGSPP